MVRFLLVAVILLASGVAVRAQSNAARADVPSRSAKAESTDDREHFRQDFIKEVEEYKASLDSLASSSESSLKQLAERQDKLKGLYAEGLIARRKIEASELALAEALARVESVRKEIASVEATLEEARKPPPPFEASAATELGAVVARIEPAWTTGSRQIDGLIRHYAARYEVDPYLVYCVMHQESRFGAVAVSPKGAQGLMQLMPRTAARYGVTNPYDPAQNIMAGTRYLQDLLRLFDGRVDLALAGYNAGEGAVMKYGNRVPPYAETRNYVRIIRARYMKNTGISLTSKTAPRTAKGGRKLTIP
jgi:soluble lytic murein transglycosylase-like protein